MPGPLRPCAVAALAALVLLAPGAGRAVQWPWRPNSDVESPVYPDVTATAEWTSQRLGSGGVVVVDVRPADLYLQGHIPGAVSVPPEAIPVSLRTTWLPDELATALAGFGLTGRGRIVCYGRGSMDADAAWLFWALDAAGAEGPMILDGGIDAWTDGGRPLENGGMGLPPATWTGAARPDRCASAAYVALKFGEEGHEIIDTRGQAAWSGSIDRSEWGEPVRRGHIPHALPYDFAEFAGDGGALLAPDETRDAFSLVGPRPSSPVSLDDEFIIHGAGGSDGALGYFLVRRAGLPGVRYFSGGWDEWSGDASLPVVRIVEADELKYRLAREKRWFRPDAVPGRFAFFDVRHWGDYAGGHIPGSVGLSSSVFSDSLDVCLERNWPGLDRLSAPIVTYCYGPNCIRSRACSTIAARAGFVNVERFMGGLADWRFAGGELVKDQELLDRLVRDREKAQEEAARRKAAREREEAAGTGP